MPRGKRAVTPVLPVEPKEQDDNIEAVEIAYIDPRGDSLVHRYVFCDPGQWKWPYQTHALISADLINLLTESKAIKRLRLKELVKRLERCRMGFWLDLIRIRGIVAKLQAGAEPDSNREVCPVHFYNPQSYIDKVTMDLAREAMKVYKKQIETELIYLNENLGVLSGASWRSVMQYILDSGTQLTALAKEFVEQTHADKEQKRDLENAITGGLRDQVEELEHVLAVLQAELDGYEAQKFDLEKRSRANPVTIRLLGEKINELRELWYRPDERPEPETPEEPWEDNTSQIEAMQNERAEKARKAKEELLRQLREKWATLLAEARAEADRLRPQIADWEKRLKAADGGEIAKLEQQAQQKAKAIQTMKQQLQETMERVQQLQKEVAAAESRIAKQKAQLSSLAAQVKTLPEPDPRRLEIGGMRKRFKQLEYESKQIVETNEKVQFRLAALEQEKKKLYKKLGWGKETQGQGAADDDDCDYDKPYWLRRKLATQGIAAFDENEFLYAERKFHHNRYKTRVNKERENREQYYINQMKARRHHLNLGEEDSAADAEAFGEFGPFCADRLLGGSQSDEGDRAVDSTEWVSRRRQAAYRGPSPRQEEKRMLTWPAEADGSRAYRLQQLRSALKGQLRACAACFAELLPASGVRQRLVDMVERLPEVPEGSALSALEDGDIERRLEDSCVALHGLIGEAFSLGDPFSTALRNSLEFGELRKRLSEVRTGQRQLQLELRTASGTSLAAERLGGRSALKRPDLSRPGEAAADDARAQAPEESLVSGIVVPKRKRNYSGQEDSSSSTDFGFSAAGEDGLDWSLLKKSEQDSGFRQDHQDASGLRHGSTPSPANFSRPRLTRPSAECDFKEYMSLKQKGPQLWRSVSSPAMLLEQKALRCPSLPSLMAGTSVTKSEGVWPKLAKNNGFTKSQGITKAKTGQKAADLGRNPL